MHYNFLEEKGLLISYNHSIKRLLKLSIKSKPIIIYFNFYILAIII